MDSTIKSKTVKKLIARIKPHEGIEDVAKFQKTVRGILKELGWKFFDDGGFNDVYCKRGVKYVVKLNRDERNPFHPIDAYKEGYLRPVYMTANRRLAIQDKVITYNQIESRAYKALNEAVDALERAKRNFVKARAKFIEELKPVRKSKIKRYRRIPDLREDNIGVHNGIPVMIDLNNHVFDLYEGD